MYEFVKIYIKKIDQIEITKVTDCWAVRTLVSSLQLTSTWL